MVQRLKSFLPASGTLDTTQRRLRAVPGSFFLIWRWSMWLYALIVIVSFEPKYKPASGMAISYQQIATILLTVTFIQTLVVTFYAPLFRRYRSRLHYFTLRVTQATSGQQKRRGILRLLDEKEQDIMPALARTRNIYWDTAIYSLDLLVCGLVMYYSGPFAAPPFGNGSPFYRYGMSTAFAAALAYRYRGGLLVALGYDCFAILGMLVPAPGSSTTHYPATVIDIIGSLIDTPIAALLAAYLTTLIESYAQSKRREQHNARTQRALVHVGESLLKYNGDPEGLLQQSAQQIRQGGHFQRTIIALLIQQEQDAGPPNPIISTIIESNLTDETSFGAPTIYLQQALLSKQKVAAFEPQTEDNGIARCYLPLFKEGQLQLILGAESWRMTPFDQRQEEFLTIAGSQLLIALENMRLTVQMIELAASAERGRIAREIHDGLAQLIYMLCLTAETCEAQAQRISERTTDDPALLDPLTERLSRLVLLSKQALWETRHYMFSLKPLMSGATTLTQMLSNQVQEFETISDLPVHLIVLGDEEQQKVEQRQTRHYAQVGAAIFRIVQEALTNAYKHANATELTLQIHFQTHEIAVNIDDNGQGLPVRPQGGAIYSGRGLDGMRERTSELGGSFAIQPSPSGGVRISASIPL
ncbi:GAF domain-containing sensor histidine kinase [Tengunoibacter tsumagoiensis]|uniref:Histidine kinase domain-containing protein n=1 Tax=Tengunoibacter tsumagoiensis TaxID=2014871 RepID=A0A401ZXN4_9CHLR|nr:ATP-binding protein [Tengunoibacter tsumagoiensis]GCE11593.1 hypothetical protein KTT_14520 [Tengunoibacter tsumagoiensis]